MLTPTPHKAPQPTLKRTLTSALTQPTSSPPPRYALAEAPQCFTTPFSTWLRQNWSLKRGLNNLTLE